MRGILAITLTLSLTTLSIAVFADQGVIYKWRDANGQTSYGQTPPEGVATTIVKTHSPNVDSKTANKDLQQRLEAFDGRQRQRDKADKEESIEARNARVRKRNCKTARGNLGGLTAHGQVSVKDGDSYRKLTEQERQQRINAAQANIEKFCSDNTASNE